MKLSAAPPEILESDYDNAGNAIITIAFETEIYDLLYAGLDNYEICQQLGCSALDVINAARKKAGIKKLLPELPFAIIDGQETGPDRLLLFPPVPSE